MYSTIRYLHTLTITYLHTVFIMNTVSALCCNRGHIYLYQYVNLIWLALGHSLKTFWYVLDDNLQ